MVECGGGGGGAGGGGPGVAARGSAASPAVQVLSRAAGNRGAAAMSTFRQESVEDFYEMGEELGR